VRRFAGFALAMLLWPGTGFAQLPEPVAQSMAAPVPAAPQPAACPARSTPALSVDLVDPEPRLLPPLSARRLRIEAGGSAEGADPHHLGLTISRVEWRSDITVRSRGAQGGPVCAVPAELRIRLVHAEHTIRLAREVPPGGCLANEIMAHERRHAEVNRRTLRDAATDLRSLSRSWAARAESRAADVNAAAIAMQEDLAQVLEPVLARLRASREAGHAAIDTPEEYRRLGRICPEDQRRLRAALRGS
jgi:hypothetical protein